MTPRQERAAKGLCPECGAEAAPYYLCDRCHSVQYAGKVLRSLVAEGFATFDRDPRDRRRFVYSWTRKPGLPSDRGPGSSRSLRFGERGKPRLRSVPVDVDRELRGIFARAGRPLTIEEIREAWVRLRPKPGRSALEGMAAVVRAEDKRARKRARNARLAEPAAAPEPACER